MEGTVFTPAVSEGILLSSVREKCQLLTELTHLTAFFSTFWEWTHRYRIYCNKNKVTQQLSPQQSVYYAMFNHYEKRKRCIIADCVFRSKACQNRFDFSTQLCLRVSELWLIVLLHVKSNYLPVIRPLSETSLSCNTTEETPSCQRNVNPLTLKVFLEETGDPLELRKPNH